MTAVTRILTLAGLLALLSACAITPLRPGCLRIGRNGQFCPLAPAQLPAVAATHIVSIHHDGRTDTFMGSLQIDAQALRLAGFSLFGTTLFTLTYDGHHVVQLPGKPAMHADLLVAMLELTLAKPDELRPRLHDLTLTVSRHGDTQVRELSEQGHLIAHVEKRGAPLNAAHITISIPPARLSVEMTPLDNNKDAQ